jgi:hypothetical protein
MPDVNGEAATRAAAARVAQIASSKDNLRITGGVFRTGANNSSSQC